MTTANPRAWDLVSAEDACALLARGARGLDVRSESEFARGALPHFSNVPILNDEARHAVGLTYKQKGQDEAIQLGHHLVDPQRAHLVSEWMRTLEPGAPAERLLLCWRGGLRSSIAAEWLAATGFAGRRVQGGYKAVRNELLNHLAHAPPALVLSGPTGSGKTAVLNKVAGALNLEYLANHRGSAFGRAINGAQPAQGTFENAVALNVYGRTKEFLVEDEGVMIGRLMVPIPVRTRIAVAPLVILEVERGERIARIFTEYVAAPARAHGLDQTHAHLRTNLHALTRRLGGLRTREVGEAMERAFASPLTDDAHAAWIDMLLKYYYDPAYAFGEARRPRPVLFRGGRADVVDFLRDRAGRA